MAVSITAEKTEGATVLVASGEVDVSNATELREAIEAALAEGPSALAVDIAEVPYIDSTGIGVLVACAHEAAESGVAYAVRNPQRNVARVFAMLDVAERLGVTSTDEGPADGGEGPAPAGEASATADLS